MYVDGFECFPVMIRLISQKASTRAKHMWSLPNKMDLSPTPVASDDVRSKVVVLVFIRCSSLLPLVVGVLCLVLVLLCSIKCPF